MTRPIDAPMAMRPGARPWEVSILTVSSQSFFMHGEFVDEVQPRFVTDTGACWHANRALWRHGHFRLDDVFLPISFAASHVARQREIRKCRARDVVRPS